MLIILPDNSPALVDSLHLPRYWAAVWCLLYAPGWARSTVRRKLSHIEALYCRADANGIVLDDCIFGLDIDVLTSLLEAFFIEISNVSEPRSQATQRWRTAYSFVRDSCFRIERNPHANQKVSELQSKIALLDKLYTGLRTPKRRFKTETRSLPKIVVKEMLDMTQPGSPQNPFRLEATQWRIYCIVVLLLFQGLRRSEALLLRADCIETQVDVLTGLSSSSLRIQLNDDAGDSRANPPSIKTPNSVRAMPITQSTAEVVENYVLNYRGLANHSYLLSSVRRKPLSIEAVNKAFQRISSALSVEAKLLLVNRTGSNQLTPHALRHTCAVLRMRQMLSRGDSPELAMSYLRSFFGWSRNSMMPMLYAKEALDERLNDSWNAELDDRVDVLRNFPE